MKSFGGCRPVRSLMATLVALALPVPLLAACSAGASSNSSSNAGEVLVYDGGGSWGEAQRKAYFAPFEKETGIKVVPVAGDASTAMRTTIEKGAPSMDLVDVSPADLDSWSKAGLVQAIDYSKWKSANQADFKPYPADPNGAPSLIFATQIAYDKAATKRPINDWSDFWNTAEIPGKRTMGSGMCACTGIFEAALMADGVAPQDLYPLDIDRAFKKLDEIKPDILKFWGSGAESVQLLADRQVSAVSAWNGRVDSLKAENPNIESTWNDAILTVDYWVIPKGAKNSANAQKFVEFASRPDRQAAFAKAITYSPTNTKAYADIPADRQELLPTSPNHKAVVVSSNKFWNSDSGNGKPWYEEIVDRWQKWLAE